MKATLSNIDVLQACLQYVEACQRQDHKIAAIILPADNNRIIAVLSQSQAMAEGLLTMADAS